MSDIDRDGDDRSADEIDRSPWCAGCDHSMPDRDHAHKWIRMDGRKVGPFCTRNCAFCWVIRNDERALNYLDFEAIAEGPEFVTDGGRVQDGDDVERRRPDWWALEPCVQRRDTVSYEVGHHSEVTNHYVVEVTREINHPPNMAAEELGLRVDHKLAEVVDDYERVHTDIDRIAPLYDDTLAGRRLVPDV